MTPPPRAYLDTAGCSRPSPAVHAAVIAHLEREAEVGGYVAHAEAAPRIEGLREALARLCGAGPADVALVENATRGFAHLLWAWPLEPGARIGVARWEYGSNRLALEARAGRDGLELIDLPVDGDGRLDPDGLARLLAGPPLDLVTFPVIASHRGLVHPAAGAVQACHGRGVPVVLDVAQAAGHVPIDAIGADAMVGTSRKWLGGPRGVGFAAVRPEWAARLRPLSPVYGAEPGARQLDVSEHAVAARVGLAVAVDELARAGPVPVAEAIAAAGRSARSVLDGVGGWRAQEPLDEPSGVVSLAHPEHDPFTTAARLLAAGVVTSAIAVARAPHELRRPVLRASVTPATAAEEVAMLAHALAR